MSLSSLMTDDHPSCDHIFARVETLAAKADWPAAAAAMAEFSGALHAHFAAEEDHLFPAFEAATGMSGGPTTVMRAEHDEMRTFLDSMQAAIDVRDADEFAGEAETLMIMIQQHNMKEENILYPMCDARLADRSSALADTLDAALHANTTAGATA